MNFDEILSKKKFSISAINCLLLPKCTPIHSHTYTYQDDAVSTRMDPRVPESKEKSIQWTYPGKAKPKGTKMISRIRDGQRFLRATVVICSEYLKGFQFADLLCRPTETYVSDSLKNQSIAESSVFS